MLVPIPILEQCFDVWSMDSISGKPSSQDYNTVYTCINEFTKFVKLIPCSKGKGVLSAPECANPCFSNIIRFGILKIVLYDHNSGFTSNFWKALWESLGIKVLFTIAYHP